MTNWDLSLSSSFAIKEKKLRDDNELGGVEVPCNLTQVVSNTLGGTSVSGETITTFYEPA
jgi:hypothetical protein